ncbi:MAG: lipid-binding SYLF domain-containing protein [Chitinophagaceae bacterium]
MQILKFSLMVVLFSAIFLSAYSQAKDLNKIETSAQVLNEFGKMKENIPEKMFNVAEGLIIVPKMLNAGFGVAGKRGKGIAVIKNANGSWSNPVFVTLTGGSLGLQAGVQSVDLVLIFKSRETLENIGKGSFTLGGDASVTAGPIGRNSGAATDYKLDAEVYSYSKSKGLFAGVSLGGSSLHIDKKANQSYYGKKEEAKTLFAMGNKGNSKEITSLKRTLNGLFL